MAWLVFLGLLLTMVPFGAVLWRKLSGRTPVEEVKQPVQASKPVRFGNQTELVLLLGGICCCWPLAAGFAVSFDEEAPALSAINV